MAKTVDIISIVSNRLELKRILYKKKCLSKKTYKAFFYTIKVKTSVKKKEGLYPKYEAILFYN